jgi:hypothetical protein
MVDEDPTHRFSGGRKEVPAAVELLIPDQSQVSFVNEGGGIEGVPGGFRCHPRGREFSQLVVDQRQQLIGRLAVALLDGREDAGHVVHRRGRRENRPSFERHCSTRLASQHPHGSGGCSRLTTPDSTQQPRPQVR